MELEAELFWGFFSLLREFIKDRPVVLIRNEMKKRKLKDIETGIVSVWFILHQISTVSFFLASTQTAGHTGSVHFTCVLLNHTLLVLHYCSARVTTGIPKYHVTNSPALPTGLRLSRTALSIKYRNYLNYFSKAKSLFFIRQVEIIIPHIGIFLILWAAWSNGWQPCT